MAQEDAQETRKGAGCQRAKIGKAKAESGAPSPVDEPLVRECSWKGLQARGSLLALCAAAAAVLDVSHMTSRAKDSADCF